MSLTKLSGTLITDNAITTEKLASNTVANFANTAAFAQISARVDSAFNTANNGNSLSARLDAAFSTANTANNTANNSASLSARLDAAFSTANTANTNASGSVPKISSISIANSTYHVLDDTAVNVGGGYIVITGTGFASGAEVIIGETPATSTTFVNSTTLRAQVPSANAATYTVYVVNTDGGSATKPRGLTYSGVPTWVTGSTLANVTSNTAFTGSLSATGATSYAVASGSSLPTGMTLVTANGYYYGNISVGSDTTYNFTVKASDAENQDSDRAFSLTTLVTTPYRTDSFASYLRLALPFDQTYQFSDIAYKISGSPNTTSISQMNSNKVSAISSNRTKWSSFGYTSSFFEDTKASPSCKYTLPVNLNLGSDFTIEGWFWPTGNGNNWAIANADVGSRLLLGVESGSEFYYDAFQEMIVRVPAGSWYHIAFTNQKLFVNGIERKSHTFSSTSFSILHIGQQSDTDGNSFLGNIQDVRVYIGVKKYTSNFTPGDNSIIQDYQYITPL